MFGLLKIHGPLVKVHVPEGSNQEQSIPITRVKHTLVEQVGRIGVIVLQILQ
jgi:hypothetical protein